SFSDCYLSDEEPDQEDTPPAEEPAPEVNDDYDVLDDLLSDLNSTTADQVSKQQPESSTSPKSPAESSAKSESLADPKSSTESVVEPAPEEQPALIPEPDTEPEVDQDPEPKEGKDLWAKYQEESDEYDWDILAFEVEESPTTRIEDEYQEEAIVGQTKYELLTCS
ncbi:hypothetical protein RhiirA4_456870, partial [Rhizophagus irregularis]